MSERYDCRLPQRRQAVLDHATLNGIDYLEVEDRPLADGTVAPQARLALYFVKPVAALAADARLQPGQVRIDGGDQVRQIRVLAVQWPAAADNPLRVAIDVDAYGDFSTYTLRLLESPGSVRAPAWLDARLAQVDFSFKAGCPTDFDCAAAPACAGTAPIEPQIDYLAKDYTSFRQLMLDRLSTVMPQWTERSEADLGIAAVEVLAYAADQLSYYQDAVATEGYLGTARRRSSVRRHARILDYAMHDGCNARTWVWVKADTGTDGAVLRAHTPLLAADTLPDAVNPDPPSVPDPAGKGRRVPLGNVPDDCQVFETLHDLVLHPCRNEIEIYTWGDEDCCLPRGATAASLRDDGSGLGGLKAGDLLLFEEVADAAGIAADADPTHRQVVRLNSVTAGVRDELFGVGVVEVAWAPEDALAFSLCLWRRGSIASEARPVSVARGNIVLADHGRTVVGESLLPAEVPSAARYRPRVVDGGVTQAVAFDAQSASGQAAQAALVQDARAALPQITLTQEHDVWSCTRDLLGSSRFAEDFVVETENDGRAWLRFGDGVLGRRPPPGARFAATYRVGVGAKGNVGAGALRLAVVPPEERLALKQLEVRNPLPAQGGAEPESTDQVRLFAPHAFQSPRRAVLPADYAALAESHPEVQKAVASRRWTGSWNTVFVTIDRRGGIDIDAAFQDELLAFLEPCRTMGHDIEIEPPQRVALDIALSVCVGAEHLRSAVKAALVDTFASRLRAAGQPGFFHPDRLTFGQTIYLSAIVAEAMKVPGVTWVSAQRFQRQGEASRGELEVGRIDIGRTEIAVLDNQSTAPGQGRLDLAMVGGI